MQSSGVAIIFTLFFAHLGHDYLSIQTRLGLFQQLGGFYIIGMLTNVAIYPSERDVAYRESSDGAYSLDSFLASYTIVELPFEVINALFFGILAVFAIGLPRTAATYFVASLACFSGLSCGESLGIMFNTLFSHTGFAINLMGVILALANSMAGILSLDMPSLFEYLNYLSPIRYQVRGVAYYSMRGLSFDCNFDNDTCPIATGEQALRLYKFDEHPLVGVVGMGACVVVYRLLAWALLVVVRRRATG
jgi:ABC-type multidrug transport system permease subunit